jgi:hypothetical protein
VLEAGCSSAPRGDDNPKALIADAAFFKPREVAVLA